jgi:thiol-disulfide isomerase/thioredoxin
LNGVAAALARGWLPAILFAFAFAVAARAEPPLGSAIPAFDTQLLDGRTLAATELAGRPLLVVFWATWCPICQKEMPMLDALYRRYRARGLELLAVSIDAERLEVDEFWRDHRYAFPVAMRSARHSEIFGITRTPPRFFLVDRKGRLAFKHLGELGRARLQAQIERLL